MHMRICTKSIVAVKLYVLLIIIQRYYYFLRAGWCRIRGIDPNTFSASRSRQWFKVNNLWFILFSRNRFSFFFLYHTKFLSFQAGISNTVIICASSAGSCRWISGRRYYCHLLRRSTTKIYRRPCKQKEISLSKSSIGKYQFSYWPD